MAVKLAASFGAEVTVLSSSAGKDADARKLGVQQVLQFDSGMELIQAANHSRQDAIALNAMLTGQSATINTTFPGTIIGNQLQQVAKIITQVNFRAASNNV